MGVLTIAGVSIKNLCKGYQVSGKRLTVLDGLTTQLADGDITVILGRSGCGKTTLLRILGGFETHDSGELIRPPHEKIGMVFQDSRLMPWLNVYKNITFGLSRHQAEAEAVRTLIKTVGLSGFEGAYPSQLSGGMQQRVALARALSYDADLILMDEPFAALDHFTRETMQSELLHIHHHQGKSIIFVTHSIDEALLLGQKILVLNRGKAEREISLSDFDYPRDILSPKLIGVKKDILSTIHKGV
ncbi:MAG: ABC transporter ATP-binding protein [Candidatus Fimivivens sp.]